MAATADARAAISDSTWCCASIAWACRPVIFCDQRLLLALHPGHLLALGDQGGPLGRQVGPALGQAGEHVALRAHRVLHQDQPGRELVRALRLQHDRELAHAAVLVGGAGDPADQLVAGHDAGQGVVDLALGPGHLGLGDLELLAEQPVPGLGGHQLTVHPGHLGPGGRQLGLGRVQRVRRVPQRGRGLVHVGLEVLQRPVHLVLAGPRVRGLGRSHEPQAESGDHGEGQRGTGTHGRRDSGRSTTVLTGRCAVSVRPGPGMRPWNGHSARSG